MVNHFHSHHRTEVDGLRSIAVLPVVLFHASPSLVPGGYLGVDMFFVISGFLISLVIFRELDDGRFSLLRFYERRIRRIFPALTATTICTIMCGYFLLTPQEYKELFQSLVAAISFLSNLYFFLKSNYFDAIAEDRPLLHTWSLSVEEQFYLCFPILVLSVNWLFKGRSVLVFLSAAIASAVIAIWWGKTSSSFVFYSTPTRAWELLVGAMAGCANYKYGTLIARKWLVVMLEMLAMLAILLPYWIVNYMPLPIGLLSVPTVAGTGLLLIVAHSDSLTGRVLSLRAPVLAGTVSYSMYLVHQPVFVFGKMLSHSKLTLPVSTACLAMVFILSWLSWRYVEQPFRNPSLFSARTVFLGFGAVSAICISIGLLGNHFDGFPQRFRSDMVELVATANASPFRASCHTDGIGYLKPKDACHLGKEHSTWAIMGDSHALEIGYSLSEKLKTRGDGVSTMTFSSCMPALTFSTKNPGCSEWTAEAVSFLQESTEIKHVVLVYRHAAYLSGFGGGWTVRGEAGKLTHYSKASDPGALDLYWDSFRAIVERLSRSGKQVLVLKPIPELAERAPRYVYFTKSNDVSASRSVSEVSKFPVAIDLVDRFADLAQIPNVRVFDPAEPLCSNEQCLYVKDNKLLYIDDNHVSVAGANLIVEDMLTVNK